MYARLNKEYCINLGMSRKRAKTQLIQDSYIIIIHVVETVHRFRRCACIVILLLFGFFGTMTSCDIVLHQTICQHLMMTNQRDNEMCKYLHCRRFYDFLHNMLIIVRKIVNMETISRHPLKKTKRERENNRRLFGICNR